MQKGSSWNSPRAGSVVDEQPARLGGQRPASGARSGFDRTQAGEHDNPLGAGKQFRGARHIVGMRRHRRRARQQFARGPRQIRRSVPGPALQIERNADHHRPAFAARLQERVAYRDRHALGHVQAVIGSARGRDERRLVDLLVVPAALQRRFPGEHHQRQVSAHGRGQRGDQLRHAGPAGDGRHAHVPASFARTPWRPRARNARAGHRSCGIPARTAARPNSCSHRRGARSRSARPPA